MSASITVKPLDGPAGPYGTEAVPGCSFPPDPGRSDGGGEADKPGTVTAATPTPNYHTPATHTSPPVRHSVNEPPRFSEGYQEKPREFEASTLLVVCLT